MPPSPHRNGLERAGDRRRREILAAAADVATAEGLEGLSIAGLAREVGMSKSGVAAHFDSKEDLQLHAITRAAAGYAEHVIAPPAGAEPGVARVRAMMEAWIGYVEGVEYRGGCFFASAGAEFSARPGAVRNLVAEHTASWIRALESEIRTATRLGELGPHTDERLLAFHLHALVQEANLRRGLLDDDGAFDDARALLASALVDAANDAPTPQGDRT
ncbi:MAG: TetR/AcrR family transcriptional regulator [Deltaproteobacteria bacterium]|nr:TetR/AcrR family transcriptional regulator [Deltaproteobacteria bacterium]